jgi:hypothetical protein
MHDQIAAWMLVSAEELRKKSLLDLGIQPPPLSDYPDGEAVTLSSAAILAQRAPKDFTVGPSVAAELEQIDTTLRSLRVAQEALTTLRSRLLTTGSLGAPTQTTSQQTS